MEIIADGAEFSGVSVFKGIKFILLNEKEEYMAHLVSSKLFLCMIPNFKTIQRKHLKFSVDPNTQGIKNNVNVPTYLVTKDYVNVLS